MCTQQGAGKRVGGTFDSHVSSTSALARPFGSECRISSVAPPFLPYSHIASHACPLPRPFACKQPARHAAPRPAHGVQRSAHTGLPYPQAWHSSTSPRSTTDTHRSDPPHPSPHPAHQRGPAASTRRQRCSAPEGTKSPPPPPDLGPAMLMTHKFVPAAEGRKRPGTRTPRPGQRIPGRPTPGSQARRLEHSASSALAVRP